MVKVIDLSRDELMKIAASIVYRDGDEAEAKEFGCSDVPDCFRRANHEFATYLLAVDFTDEGEEPVAPIIVQRDGQIVFFIAKDVKHKHSLIRALRKKAEQITKRCGPITVKTMNWYDEAKRMLKLIGFKEYLLTNRWTKFVYGYDMGLPDGR
ncbi:MAG: hypothetical protein B6D63_04110 [Candidatus Latescibacteria bacterium 4484_7]|nr:MAG: hypothetical protein B6D63_04110 [Candidatus Latescibacteria bacterium 4484_7]